MLGISFLQYIEWISNESVYGERLPQHPNDTTIHVNFAIVTNITDIDDFSDLHITGEFDNRPGTGRFLRIFSCVVTYPTGAGRRLYINILKVSGACQTSYDARPGIVRCPHGHHWNPTYIQCYRHLHSYSLSTCCPYAFSKVQWYFTWNLLLQEVKYSYIAKSLILMKRKMI